MIELIKSLVVIVIGLTLAGFFGVGLFNIYESHQLTSSDIILISIVLMGINTQLMKD
jgi:hypothetical protein